MFRNKSRNKSRNKLRSPSSDSPPFFSRGSTIAARIRAIVFSARRQLRPQRLQQASRQPRSVENRPQQQQAAPRIFLARGLDQHLAHFRIADKTLRTLQQPDVKLAFSRTQVRGQLRVVALRVIRSEERREGRER